MHKTINKSNTIQCSYSIPRLIIGAPAGRSGKTTLTLGLLRALSRRGISTQPFKKGPDYIDPGWLTLAAGKPSYNLDSFLMDREQIKMRFAHCSLGSRLSIIEGAMGLFDGLDLQGSSSTAEIAKITNTPVLFVIDATRMTRSTAALVKGYQHFDPDVKIAGVILNKVARPRHEAIARSAIEEFCGIPVIGAIPKSSLLEIPDRHLGLITNGETNEGIEILNRLGDVVQNHLDLEAVLKLADQAPKFIMEQQEVIPAAVINPKTFLPKKLRLGVIRDKAFSFYYPENLEYLANRGAEIIFIDSLQDSKLPVDLDALYIGGGFPEVFANELEKNITLREEIRQAGEEYMPIYAECGGLMYLGRTIITGQCSREMVGLLPFDTEMKSKPQGHGYTIMESRKGNFWFDQGLVRGHEFHNSRILNLPPDTQFGFRICKGGGIDGENDGIIYKNVFAAYNHINAIGCPSWAEHFINKALEYHYTKHLLRVKAAGV